MNKTKICTKCKKRKLVCYFHKNKPKKNGVDCYCKKCVAIYNQKYHQTHRVEIAKQHKKYRKVPVNRIRKCFKDIKQRCDNPENKDYKYYGERGIKCLFKSIDEFVNYIINNLRIDPYGLEIDRIDNNGHYEKGNIRFVTHKENCNNRRNSK